MRAARDRAMKNEAKGAPEKGQLDVLDPVCGKRITLDMVTKLTSDEADAFLKEWGK